MHPGIRCFYYAKRDWHFDIDSNRLSVWAHAIDEVSVLCYAFKQVIILTYIRGMRALISSISLF